MIDNLVSSARRLAAIYRYHYILPSHVLHALTNVQGADGMIEDAGYQCEAIRRGLVSGFRDFSVKTETTNSTVEPSSNTVLLLEQVKRISELQGRDDVVPHLVDLVLNFEGLDSLSREVLNEACIEDACFAENEGPESELQRAIDSCILNKGTDPSTSERSNSLTGKGEAEPDQIDVSDFLPDPGAERSAPVEEEKTGYADPRKPVKDSESRTKKPQPKEIEEARRAIANSRTDLSFNASAGLLDPVFGRDMEIDRIIEILMRRRKPNILLVGEPGVGKSAIIDGLALRLSKGEGLTESLARRSVHSISLSGLVAGTRFRGDFESRLNMLVDEAAEQNTITFFDEFHLIMGSGATGAGGMDGANILKPLLARGGFSVIGATTLQEAAILRRDRAFMRRFEVIHLKEPGLSEMTAILAASQKSFLSHHGVSISSKMQASLLRAACKFLPERRDPDRCFDILDLAGVSCAKRFGKEITPKDLLYALSRLGANVPYRENAENIEAGKSMLDRDLKDRLIDQLPGQSGISRQMSAVLANHWSGCSAAGLIALKGMPNSGKSRIAKAAAGLKDRRLHQLKSWSVPGGLEERQLQLRIAQIADSDPEAVIAIRQGEIDSKLQATLTSFLSGLFYLEGEDRSVCLKRLTVILLQDGPAEKTSGRLGFTTSTNQNESLPMIMVPPLKGKDLECALKHVIGEIITLYQDIGLDFTYEEVVSKMPELNLVNGVLLEDMHQSVQDAVSSIQMRK